MVQHLLEDSVCARVAGLDGKDYGTDLGNIETHDRRNSARDRPRQTPFAW